MTDVEQPILWNQHVIPYDSNQLIAIGNDHAPYEFHKMLHQARAAIYWRSQFEAYARHFEWCGCRDCPDPESCTCGLNQRRQEAAHNPEPLSEPQ